MTERKSPKVTDKLHGAQPFVDAGPVSAPDPAAPLDEPAEEVDELAEARAQAAEYLDHLQRLQAEFENYRKRTIKEQTRALEFGSEGLVRRLLEVLDEFQLALASAESRPELEPLRVASSSCTPSSSTRSGQKAWSRSTPSAGRSTPSFTRPSWARATTTASTTSRTCSGPDTG
jgi:hypothetical protein